MNEDNVNIRFTITFVSWWPQNVLDEQSSKPEKFPAYFVKEDVPFRNHFLAFFCFLKPSKLRGK